MDKTEENVHETIRKKVKEVAKEMGIKDERKITDAFKKVIDSSPLAPEKHTDFDIYRIAGEFFNQEKK